MVTKLFQLLILLSPICVGADINMDMLDVIFFRTGVMTLVLASLLDKPKRELTKEIKICVSSLLGIMLANMFLYTFMPAVMHTTMNMFLGIVAFLTVYRYYDEKQSIKKYVLIAAGINLLLFICQKFNYDPVFDKSIAYIGAKEGGFLGNGPRMMTYFALVTPFLPMYLLPLCLVLACVTKQVIILASVFVVLFFRLKRIKYKLILILLALVSVILLKDKIWAAFSFRFNMSYAPILTAFFDRPLLGFGLGNRPIPELEIMGSSYLQFIVGVGVVGALWFGYVFKTFYRSIRNNLESIALISLALIMAVEYPLEIMRLQFTIIAIIALFMIKKDVCRI